MTERETLLAEIARQKAYSMELKAASDAHLSELAESDAVVAKLEARLAELDKEPDYEAWRPALEAYYATAGKAVSDPLDHTDKLNIRSLIAAFAKAPPDFFAENAKKSCPMTEAEIEALAKHYGQMIMPWSPPVDTLSALIRETLSHVQPRWPSEEVQALLNGLAEMPPGGELYWRSNRLNDFAAIARRIRAYQTGEPA